MEFRVRVSDHPIEGLRVEIYNLSKGNAPLISATTDATGTAVFRAIDPGTYTFFASPGRLVRETIAVDGHQTGSAIVELRWPASPVFMARTIRGRLYGLGAPQWLYLVDTHGSRLASSLSVDGSFDFGSPPPGLYFVRLSGKTDIGVEISRSAEDRPMDVNIYESGCGAFYLFRENANPPSPTTH